MQAPGVGRGGQQRVTGRLSPQESLVAFPSGTLLSPALNNSALLAVPLGGLSLRPWGLELELGMGSNRQHQGSALQKEVR